MLKFNKGLTLIIILSLLVVLTSCGSDDQKTMQPQEETKLQKINYQTKINKLDREVKEVLSTIQLESQQPSKNKAVTKLKQTKQYQFEWTYNHYQLPVPLFGADGKLLSDYKAEIIAKFKEKFSLVDLQWTKQQEQKLILKLGFKAKGEFKLITHQLIFTQPQPKAKMAIIIDDFGFNRRGTQEILSIDRPLTAAVLPFRPYSEKDAQLAKQAGLEVLLHQPLEPMSPQANPGQGAIYTDMSQQKIKEVFSKNLNSLPQVSGVNHHMGSKASADLRVMNQLLHLIKAEDLFYVDSSTSHNSVGAKVARDKNVPTKENYLFIDNVDQQSEIEKMILRLSKIALKKGELLIIGHVKENTAQAIKATIPQLEERGIKLVRASQIVN